MIKKLGSIAEDRGQLSLTEMISAGSIDCDKCKRSLSCEQALVIKLSFLLHLKKVMQEQSSCGRLLRLEFDETGNYKVF